MFSPISNRQPKRRSALSCKLHRKMKEKKTLPVVGVEQVAEKRN